MTHDLFFSIVRFSGNVSDVSILAPYWFARYTICRAMITLPRVEGANAVSLQDFYNTYILTIYKRDHLSHSGTFLKLPDNLTPCCSLQLETASTISKADLATCFHLITQTSSEDYASSSLGWHPSQKRREMRLPDLRYLLAKTNGETPVVEAFLSFMLTYEDGHEVIYCYEVHMLRSLQGKGLGRYLMGVFEHVGTAAGMEKAMLTVFLKNHGALNFYEKLGYVEDKYSPEPRMLRNGLVKKPDYVILSKPLGQSF